MCLADEKDSINDLPLDMCLAGRSERAGSLEEAGNTAAGEVDFESRHSLLVIPPTLQIFRSMVFIAVVGVLVRCG